MIPLMDVQSEKEANFIGFQSHDDGYPPIDSDGFTFSALSNKESHELPSSVTRTSPEKISYVNLARDGRVKRRPR